MFSRRPLQGFFVGLALCAMAMTNTFAFAPYSWTMLPLLTLAILALTLTTATSKRQAAWYGFAYGVGWFATGVSWVHVSIATFGGMPLLASLSIMALLVLYLALYPLLAGVLFHLLQQRAPALTALSFAASWTLAENLRSWMLTGFPWLSLGSNRKLVRAMGFVGGRKWYHLYPRIDRRSARDVMAGATLATIELG